MVRATLVTHAKCRAVPISLDQLAELPMPPSLGNRHKPVPHIDLINSIVTEANSRGLVATETDYAVRASGNQLFGVMVLKPGAPDAPNANLPDAFRSKESSVAVGFRNSTDQVLSIGLVGGQRVFVCDNLALAGDILALRRKNTTGLTLASEMHEAFDRLLLQVQRVDDSINRLREYEVNDTEAKAKIYGIFESRAMPSSWFMKVHKAYFHPDGADSSPRSLFGIYGAATRVIREVKTASQRVEATVRVSRYFEIGK